MLSSFLLSQDFSKGSVDPTLFIRKNGNDLLLIQIYVDDIIFAALTLELCDLFANIMCSKFKMSMMGKISFFLGLQISQNPRGIFINQSKYALESLKKYGFESCDPVDTPMVEKSKLDEDKERKAVDPSHYRGMIGTLLYLTTSRPDLQFAICMCARTMATMIEQQVVLDEALVPSAQRLRIGRSNFRLPSDIQSKEPTLQVVYDVLHRSPFFRAFLVTADVPEIYMQEFWATAAVHQHSIRFKMDTKKHIFDLEAFREMLHINSSLRIDLVSSIGTDLDSSLRTDLVSSIGTDLDSSLITDLVSSIGTDLDSSLRTDLDWSIGTDLDCSLRTNLEYIKRLRIGISNFRLPSDIQSKEPTLQVVYDVLRGCPFFKAFLVTVDVPAIYMQEFWAIAYVHQHFIRFKMDRKKNIVDLEAFMEMLHISPRIPGQSFDELPFEEEILDFL
nr:uncharacterized mitochondrial protein AtMg00810-like [Tanacetum cinerariifolium]